MKLFLVTITHSSLLAEANHEAYAINQVLRIHDRKYEVTTTTKLAHKSSFKRSAISVMVADFDFEHILPHYLAHDVDRF